MRSRDTLLQGGSRGAALVAGNADESLLYKFISGDQQPRMPLGEQLTSAEIDLLKRWIDDGAQWTDVKQGAEENHNTTERFDVYKGRRITDEERNYWAFRTPVRAPFPVVKNSAWVKNPIDAFVLAKLEAKDLRPSPPADKRTLLRRVTFDLTGLPPTPEELKAFLIDNSPDAYAKVVKRLLASPRYGERWAQHWLDVVRFGETNGYELTLSGSRRGATAIIRLLNEDALRLVSFGADSGRRIDPQKFEPRCHWFSEGRAPARRRQSD
jgi:hypothetical protein